MNSIQGIYNQYLELVKLNPVVAALLVPTVLAAGSYLVRGIPTKIWQFLKRQFTTSLVMTSQETGSNYETFISFMEWFNSSRWAKWSRSYMIDGRSYYGRKGRSGPEDTLGVGLGSHFFVYHGRLFFMRREMLGQQQQGHQINYQITLSMVGRNQQILKDLINDFRWTPKTDSLGIYRYRGDGWFKLCEAQKRNLDTVVIDGRIKERLSNIITNFEVDRDWYVSRGLAWKTTLMLEGPPGSGKSSLIKALASHFGYNLYLLNLNYISDDSLETALANATDRSFIVMEDFDDVAGDFKRHHISVDETPSTQWSMKVAETPTPIVVKKEDYKGLSLSGLLNALDGLVALDGKIIILTTNDPDSLDAALLRKGRIDHRFHLGKLTNVDIHRYVTMMFPDFEIPAGYCFADIMGCDLQSLYFENKHTPEDFINSIPTSNRISDIHYPNVATIAR